MKCNKIALAAALVLGLGAAGSAFADGGNINFVGNIKDTTCAVSGGSGTIGSPGSSNFKVLLDNAETTDFTAANQGRKPQDYYITFSDGNGGACNGLQNGNAVVSIGGTDKTYISPAGNLKNQQTGAGATQDADFQLLDDQGQPYNLLTNRNITVKVGDPVNALPAPVSLKLGVQYFSTAFPVRPGVMDSNVTYTVSYN